MISKNIDRNLPQPSIIRITKCNICKAYKKEKSSDGKFGRFKCRCGSTSGAVISITTGV